MAIENYDIQPLFATPHMRADIGHAISAEQVQFIKDLKMIKNKDNYISEDLYIFKRPELESINLAIQEALDIYAQAAMGIDQRIVVTQSWALMNQPGVGMHAHSHSNSIVSGSLYYCELPKPVSRVVFDRNATYQRIQLNPLKERQNLYNTPANVLVPKTNEVILFPSDLNHLIEANESDQPRHAIAFNSFVTGTIGDYRDVCELTL